MARRRAPSNQLAFRLPLADLLPGELIVDSFAGGGGASLGIERALGRSPDIAINHDPAAIRMHEANHPNTRHFQESVWKVTPRDVTGGRPVGLLWASPDCRHFSRAKGGKPVSPRVRGLAWVVVAWARQVRPRVICLENVPEFTTWGPLGPDSRPDKEREGQTFRRWKGQLERLGYVVDHRILNAADFGAPTSRKRIFLVARCDGAPIRWPEPSHGKGRPLPWRTAAECIDWSIPCPSIFDRKKPLKPATLARIARGIKKFVLDDPRPFIVNLTHGGRREDIGEPMRTVTGAHRGEKAVVAPTLVQTSYGERKGQAPRVPGLDKPVGTVVAGGQKHAVVAAMLKHYGGVTGNRIDQPAGTITQVDHHAVMAAHLTKLYGTATGAPADGPVPTITNGGGRGGGHAGLVAAHLTHYHSPKGNETRGSRPDAPLPTQTVENRFGLVYAFLAKYYGTAVGQALGAPLDTITGKDRFGVVTVTIDGQEYAIADIGMRMLQPHELAKAQGFPDDYHLIGNKSQQVAKIGNSVCPPVAEALVRANLITQSEQLKETA
jgi:DNA (cytosine-5)-methyltransferase 1